LQRSFFILSFFYSCNNSKYKKVEACFNYHATEVSGSEVKFDNCSKNATDYLWDFGDGNTSTKKDPIYQFQKLFPYKVTLKAYNKEFSDTITHDVSDVILIKKPNIYIYPETKIDLCVNLVFPKGGSIVKSIPDYKNGWCVNVGPSGKIDQKFDFLFYESEQPNLFQHKLGYCIDQYELSSFFEKNMHEYNFSSKEINDFIVYWIPLLNKHKYYLIYPQTKEIINKTNQLKLSIKPDNIFRLFYSIKGVDKYQDINKPEIKPIIREGFHVVEWGLMEQSKTAIQLP